IQKYIWCQTCNLQKTGTRVASRNRNIDNCIKKFLLKATEYES
ncbi:30522_t:CDS:1, partial [Racocetra persica]